jgi:uncharacterized protein (TIGR03437 family)
MYFASDSQLTALMPNSIEPGQDVKIAVNRGGTRSDDITVPGGSVLSAAPAMFTYFLDDKVARAVVQGEDSVLIGPNDGGSGMHPLRLGETGTIYANGLGSTDPGAIDGQVSPADPLARTTQTVEVLVNGTAQQVTFSGLTPGAVALYQVNFVLDPATPLKSDASDEINLRVNGVESPTLRIALSAN